MAQTRQQQQESAEKARLPAGEYEKIVEKRLEERRAALAAVEKEEERHEMETFYSYVRQCVFLYIYIYLQVTLIRSKIKSIDEGREDLWRISSQSMVSVSDEEVADLSARLELIAARTNKNAEEIRGLLKELESRNVELKKKLNADGACMRIRLVQADSLTRKFTNSLGLFESTENLIQSKSREMLMRRLQIVAPEMNKDHVTDLLIESSEIKNVFALVGGLNPEELERKLEHLRAQQRSMQRLEKNILTLNKMFLDMQNAVRQQDDQLNYIENYVNKTVEFQKTAQLDKAIELQKNIRKVKRRRENANFCLLYAIYAMI